MSMVPMQALLFLLSACVVFSRTLPEHKLSDSVGSQQGDAVAVSTPRPPVSNHAAMARWLVHETLWGSLASYDKESAMPISGIVSHTDACCSLAMASGRIFFYMTPMDEVTSHFLKEPRVSFTVSEAQIQRTGACRGIDPMDPRCARVAVLGEMRAVEGDADLILAKAFMFTRHPDMMFWPTDHKFQFYELLVKDIHLLDWFGGISYVTPDEYYESTWFSKGSTMTQMDADV